MYHNFHSKSKVKSSKKIGNKIKYLNKKVSENGLHIDDDDVVIVAEKYKIKSSTPPVPDY